MAIFNSKSVCLSEGSYENSSPPISRRSKAASQRAQARGVTAPAVPKDVEVAVGQWVSGSDVGGSCTPSSLDGWSNPMKMADDWGKHMEMTYPNGDIMDAMQIFYEIYLSRATGNTIPKITMLFIGGV